MLKKAIVIVFLIVTGVYGETTSDKINMFFNSRSEKPQGLKDAQNAFITFCNDTFTNNNNQVRSVADFEVLAESMKAEAAGTGDTMLLFQAMEIVQRAIGHLLILKNEAARWSACPYDSNAAWDHVEWNE